MSDESENIDFENLPKSVRDFIELVVKKVRYRRKIRQDVKAELTAHFEDELKDIPDQKQKEQAASGIIEDFGDPALLAVLIRRAKKRCRPLWRKIFARSFQAMGIILLFATIRITSLSIGTPVIKINYIDDLNNQARQNRSESLNSRGDFQKAVEQTSKDWPDSIAKSRYLWPGDMNDQQQADLEKMISQNRNAIEALKKGIEKPYYWPDYIQDPNYTKAFSKKTPYLLASIFKYDQSLLSGYRALAQKHAAQILWQAYIGDKKNAIENAIALYKFCDKIQQSAILLDQMVGIAIEALANQIIFNILSNTDASSDLLNELQCQLQNLYSNNKQVVNFEGEKILYYDYIQRTFTDDGKGRGRPTKNGAPLVIKDWKDAVKGFILWNYPDRKEAAKIVDDYFRDLSELANATPWQRHNNKYYDQLQAGLEQNSSLLQLVAPGHIRMTVLTWRLKTSRSALLTTLAVLQYEKNNGFYPAQLNDVITAGYLKELPLDPYSDKPLVYKKTNNNFILYSVGQNFKDDGGKVYRDKTTQKIKKWFNEDEIEDCDAVFWPVEK